MTISIRHKNEPPRQGMIQRIGRNAVDLLEIIFIGMVYIFGMIMIFMPSSRNKETKA